MTDSIPAHRALPVCFLIGAQRYWLSVFPCLAHETRHWQQRAAAIPDPALRKLALEAQRIKRGNVEGSVALAAFAPAEHRAQAVRAQVAFQSIYDYVDTLAEQPAQEPVLNARQLHQALIVAIDKQVEHSHYYAHNTSHQDGGYLEQIIDTCRTALCRLPSHTIVEAHIRRSAERIVGYQSRNLKQSQGGHHELKQWAEQQTPPQTQLAWWETAASAGSSLGLFALIAAAAHPGLTPAEATAIETGYWPWIGALHSLLDSLIDLDEDDHDGQRSLLSYYRSPQETSTRFGVLASEAAHAASKLPRSSEHTLILAAMTSHYLTAPGSPNRLADEVSEITRNIFGRITTATTSVFVLRRWLKAFKLGGSESCRRPASVCSRWAEWLFSWCRC